VPVTSLDPEMIPALAREQFPALIADPAVVYLDSAATMQKPRPVIDAVTAEFAGAWPPSSGSPGTTRPAWPAASWPGGTPACRWNPGSRPAP
jgi:hypothetical protein